MHNPLAHMEIRTAERDKVSVGPSITSRLNFSASPAGGSFGFVRKFGHKAHQGWDLYSPFNSDVYAVSDGIVVSINPHNGDLGLSLCIELLGGPVQALATRHGSKSLYALYGHLLSVSVSMGNKVTEGQVLASSGASGNASNTPPHLHFELRTSPVIGKSKDHLSHRLDPGELLGYAFYSCSA